MDVQKTNYDSVSKKYIYIVVGIVVLAIAAWGIYAYNHQNNAADDTSQQVTGKNNDIVPPAATSTAPAENLSASHTIKEYEAALIKYAKTRIQFVGCQANPNNVVYKNPVTVMLDNRAKVTDKIVIYGRIYTVAPLDYQLVTLNESVLPAKTLIDCNQSQNVATLLIEK